MKFDRIILKRNFHSRTSLLELVLLWTEFTKIYNCNVAGSNPCWYLTWLVKEKKKLSLNLVIPLVIGKNDIFLIMKIFYGKTCWISQVMDTFPYRMFDKTRQLSFFMSRKHKPKCWDLMIFSLILPMTVIKYN